MPPSCRPGGADHVDAAGVDRPPVVDDLRGHHADSLVGDAGSRPSARASRASRSTRRASSCTTSSPVAASRPGVQRVHDAAVLALDQPELRKAPGVAPAAQDLEAAVGGPVVDHDQLEVGVARCARRAARAPARGSPRCCGSASRSETRGRLIHEPLQRSGASERAGGSGRSFGSERPSSQTIRSSGSNSAQIARSRSRSQAAASELRAWWPAGPTRTGRRARAAGRTRGTPGRARHRPRRAGASARRTRATVWRLRCTTVAASRRSTSQPAARRRKARSPSSAARMSSRKPPTASNAARRQAAFAVLG